MADVRSITLPDGTYLACKDHTARTNAAQALSGLDGKLSIAQGAQNVGKCVVVGNDGNLVLGEAQASGGSAFTDESFSIQVSGWTESYDSELAANIYTAVVSIQAITADSVEWLMWDESYYTYAQAPVSLTTSAGTATFVTTTIPTGTISGTLRVAEVVSISVATPVISIGTVSTLSPGSSATASMDTTDPAHPVLSMGIPKGQPGDTAIDDTSVANNKVWSAQKVNNLKSEIENLNSTLNELIGGNTDVEHYQKNNLNFAGSATAFATSDFYRTQYFPVVAGRKYTGRISGNNLSSQYRGVFSESEPANGVSGTLVNIYSPQTPSSAGSVDIEYTATSNGYYALAYWDYGENVVTFDYLYVELPDGKVDAMQDELQNIINHGKNTDELFLQRDALQVSSNYCEMKQWTVVPYRKVVLSVHCPDDVAVWFVLRVDPYTTGSDIVTDPIKNGGKYTVDDGYSIYKIRFAHATISGSTITIKSAVSVNEATEMIEKGILCVTFEDSDVVANNTDVEKEIWANIGANHVIAHISDTHGDAKRYSNFMKMCEHFGVDCAIHSGDVSNVYASDGFQYFTGEIDKHPNVPTVACIGNHDAYSTNADMYNNIIKPFADAYGYELSTAKTYYHVDLDDADLRIIVLNIYEPRHPGYNCCITQDQIEWFIDTLADTPAGYGVIVVAHSSEKLISKDNAYDDFYSSKVTDAWYAKFPNITGDPISTIVDAFISGISITGSYTQEIADTTDPSTTVEETVSYSADFTSKNTGAEFIAYVNGHAHFDTIGYLPSTTNPQLSLNITVGGGGQYYGTQDDLPRGNGRGSVQDAFNLYAIDRTAKKVIVCRIGSNITNALTERKIMPIPYAD